MSLCLRGLYVLSKLAVTCLLPLTVLFGGDAAAQAPPPAREPPKIGATLTADVWRDLPVAENLFAILETVQPELIADRFNSGGLNVGAPAGVSGFLASSTQTQYRLGDVNISSPHDGAPLLFPEIAFWDRVEVTTGAMPVDSSAPGLAVILQPHRHSTQWTGSIEASTSGGRLISDPALHRPPSIVQLHDWARGAAIATGPVVDGRLGLTVGGTWTRNTTVERTQSSRRQSEAGSAFAHALLTVAPSTEWRALGWAQRSHHIAGQDRAIHVQSTYEQYDPSRPLWRIFGGYTQRRRTRHRPVSGLVVERLVDGPILGLVANNAGTERRWSVGGRLSPARPRARHALQVGADVEGIAARTPASVESLIGELVDGRPARVWAFKNQALVSQRHATTIAVFANDRIAVFPRMTLDLALRFESIHGQADGATAAINWRALMPSATAWWKLGTPYALELMTAYRRSGNQLLLGLLAYGDPAAPVADVFRWEESLAATGTLIARTGPGTGGDSAFSRIDPQLKRSHTDEFVISLESRPQSTLRLSVTGIARRQSSLVNVVNTGVPMSSYETFTIRDDNVDLLGAADDHELPVYNRLPASFGRDQYLLTNSGQEAATLGAVVLTAQSATDRLFLSIGATASAAIGSGGNRGFRATENDQDASGELFTNPNASTFARGRLFSDRAYVIKWTTVYRFPQDIRLGAIARYQDGQPFSRIVVVPGLNQGAEAIQAFANGRSRFAFTGTLDVRLQKGFAIGATRLAAIFDAYNLLNMTKEVEEYVVTGDRFRETTAVQPPRAFHLGVRMTF